MTELADRRRRRFLQAAARAALAGSSVALWTPPAHSQPSNPGISGNGSSATRVILLGTRGGPRVDAVGRRNSATLILVGGVPYLVDCGYGTSQQLVAAGVPLNRLRYQFITHHHSDHMLEYGSVVYNGWASGLATPVDAYGPPPLAAETRAFLDYMKFDIDTRIADEGRPDLRKLWSAHEFAEPGVVLQTDTVKVSAARVLHPPIAQAYAYRFDTPGRSVVVSGDTNDSPALIELARGADVLVHEALFLPGVDRLLARNPNAATLREHLLASHTTTEDVGRVAAAAGVKTLVLSHFVPGDDPSISDEMWAEGVRRHFDGRIVVGRDLLEI